MCKYKPIQILMLLYDCRIHNSRWVFILFISLSEFACHRWYYSIGTGHVLSLAVPLSHYHVWSCSLLPDFGQGN